MKLLIVSFFYNREDAVHDSLNTLKNSLREGYQVVLIDDGSKDQTLVELKKHESDQIKVLTQENKGLTKTMSDSIPLLIEEYDPEYLAVFGSGDLADENKYETQLAYMDQHPDVAATGVCSRIISIENGQIIKEEKGQLEADFDYLLKTMPFTHGSVVYRTDNYVESGGYDATYEFCQDWDLFFRLIKVGRIIRLPESLYARYAFEDGASVNPTKRLKQLRFQKLLKTRGVSEEKYQELLQKTREEGITAAFNDEEMMPLFKNLVKSSFFKGELQLSKKWIQTVDRIEQKNHRGTIFLLNILIKLKFPSIAMSKIFSVLYSLRERKTA